jgi:hypothetical protein
MSEERKELKVDVSFTASLKFWLAYLIVQIILMIIVFGIMFAFMAWVSQVFRGIVPQTPTMFTDFLKGIL